jgi:hypothetical protein
MQTLIRRQRGDGPAAEDARAEDEPTDADMALWNECRSLGMRSRKRTMTPTAGR